MARKPYADSRLAIFMDKRVLELRPKKSQAEIAEEAGFRSHNMIAMLKSGAAKLALDRVPATAKALECDPAYLLLLALEQETGNTAARALLEIFGTPVSQNEHGWLEEIRSASDGSDPRVTARGRAAIHGIFGK
jgi:transcriptional regulator with XRE-family HTH domain